MLFIGDVHITTKYQDRLLEQIRACVAAFPQERTIIFMGDYVYQFSYDRKALLGLFHLFTELYKQGKHLYVLAGNHDWIANHFVYEEAKQAFDLAFPDINEHKNSSQGVLKFITEPTFLELEGQDVLLFPFTHHFDQENIQGGGQFASLIASTHRNERLSGYANSALWGLLQEWRKREKKSAQLLLIHHRYIVDTAFPGQQAKFSYSSPGLSSELLEMEDLLIVSGHLHQAFVDRNYLCTGSVRHTSSLEVNQQKRCFRYDLLSKEVSAFACTVNPYVMIDVDENSILTSENFLQEMEKIEQTAFALLQGGARKVKKIDHQEKIDLALCTLLMRSATVSYHDVEKIVSSDLFVRLKEVKLKRFSTTGPQLLTNLEKGALALDRTISDWKTLLRNYLVHKYTDRAKVYEEFLQEMEVL